MDTREQLSLRALRMLEDGRQHSAEALAWARRMVPVELQELMGERFDIGDEALGRAPAEHEVYGWRPAS